MLWRRRRLPSRSRARSGGAAGILAPRLALITENANDVIVLFDPSMRIIDANERVDFHPPPGENVVGESTKVFFKRRLSA
jgi:hypothetical protein